MKVAIFGQYYQNDTRPIIKDIFVFINRNQIELVIERDFLAILYDHKIVEKKYETFSSYADLDQSFDVLISISILNNTRASVNMFTNLIIKIYKLEVEH